MGWVSLSLRKLSLRANISNLELRDIQISRTLRRTQRTLSCEQATLRKDRSIRLEQERQKFLAAKEGRPEDRNSQEYQEWYEAYQTAKEEYEYEKMDIQNEIDDELARLEDEAADKEAQLQQEQTTIECRIERY